MGRGRRRLGGAMLVGALLLAARAAAQIPLELRFDGQPFAPASPPDVSCFSVTLDRWVACRVAPGDGPGVYVLERPAPGGYRMHVSIDENRANPRRYPGDYEAQLRFDVGAMGPERVTVDLARLIHLTRPGDNARSLPGMLTDCATQPRFETPRHAWSPAAAVEFAWEPVAEGAEYRYSVTAVGCAPPHPERAVIGRATGATAVTLALPPSAAGEYYKFRIEAWKGGRLVGDLYTHDAGTHSWNYRFQVRDASVPRWAYLAGGAAGLLLLAAAGRAITGVERGRRRRRAALVTGVLIAALGLGAAGAISYRAYETRERRRAEAARARADAEREARRRELAAAFIAVAPRPAWWDEVTTPYRVDNVGDLLSAWQGHPHGRDGERQFFKAAWQGIVDHPDDEDVVATAIELLHWVERDYPYRLPLARFGYERYFTHHRRTDNCVNCLSGDTTQGLAQNLSELLIQARQYDEAIAVGRRLVEARAGDVSPYKLAETWERIAWAYWEKGEHERAREVLREALARYGATVRGDLLRGTLARFEREGAPAPAPR